MKVIAASPLVPVSDLEASIAFYRDTLGFRLDRKSSAQGYAHVALGGAGIGLIQTTDAGALAATATNISAQFWVEGLDQLYATNRAALDSLPEGRVRAPFDRDYGVREFHVKDPDGFLMFFTEDAD